MGDSGLNRHTECHLGHKRGRGSVSCPEEKGRETRKNAGPPQETLLGQALGHTLSIITSFDPYNDFGKGRNHYLHFTEQETKSQRELK